MSKYTTVTDFEFMEGICDVECDCCGKKTDFNTCNFMEVNEELRNDGWIIRKIKSDWLDFCCEECLNKFIDKK